MHQRAKSYLWKDHTSFYRKITDIPLFTKQLNDYRTKPALKGHPIIYVFDAAGGKLPADIQAIFDNEKKLGLNVTVQYWPNGNPPQIVPSSVEREREDANCR